MGNLAALFPHHSGVSRAIIVINVFNELVFFYHDRYRTPRPLHRHFCPSSALRRATPQCVLMVMATVMMMPMVLPLFPPPSPPPFIPPPSTTSSTCSGSTSSKSSSSYDWFVAPAFLQTAGPRFRGKTRLRLLLPAWTVNGSRGMSTSRFCASRGIPIPSMLSFQASLSLSEASLSHTLLLAPSLPHGSRTCFIPHAFGLSLGWCIMNALVH